MKDSKRPAKSPENVTASAALNTAAADRAVLPQKSPKLFERKLSADELADGIEAYFEKCGADGRKPTKPGLCVFLGISTSTWDNWLREAENPQMAKAKGLVADRYRGYAWPMKRAMQRISDGLEQRTDTMALFLLKQACYGGYSDKDGGVAGSGNLAITISFGDVHKNTARNYGK